MSDTNKKPELDNLNEVVDLWNTKNEEKPSPSTNEKDSKK